MIDQALRKTVDQLLRRSSDRKLHRGSSAEALALAEQAFTLAHGQPGLGQPWRAVTAYRKAMLLLRTPEATLETLRTVNDLLLEAVIASEEHEDLELGPWAKLFRLPVLHRLQMLPEGKVTEREVLEAFQECVEVLSNPEIDAEQHPYRHFRLQTQAFNCIELAAIFLGISPASLEGRGADIDLIPLRGNTWYLFASGEVPGGEIWSTRGMTLTELDGLLSTTPNAYGFVHPASEGAQGEFWAGNGVRKKVAWNQTAVLKKDLGVSDSIGGRPPQTQQPTYRSRYKEELAALTGLSVDAFTGPGGRGFQIPTSITLFGAVERG